MTIRRGSLRSRLKMTAVMKSAFVAAYFASPPALAEDNAQGRALFAPCRACHALNPQAPPMPGPNLAGLIGRPLAGDPAFDYSPVLRQAGSQGRRWDRAMLDAFLADPEAMFPGMWMTGRRLTDAAERQAFLDFLADPASR